MKPMRYLIVFVLLSAILLSTSAHAKTISSTIHAFGAYTGIIRSPDLGLGRTYRSGFGGGVEYMMNAYQAKGWFLKHARLGFGVTDCWLYRFRTPILEGVNLLLFLLSGQIAFVELDKAAVPYFGLNVGGGLMGKGGAFDVTGMFGFDYRFPNNISIIIRAGGGVDIAKGPVEDRMTKSFATYPRFFTTLGVGYTF